DPLGRQNVVEEAGQRTAEPVAEGNAETLLPAPANRGRQAIGERALEESLEATEAGQLQARRDPAQELDEGVVEKRRPELEGRRHTRAIRVHQVLAGEVLLAVAVDEPRRRIVRRAVGEHRGHVLVRIEGPETGTGFPREERRE